MRPGAPPPEKCIRRGIFSGFTKAADWARAFKITRYLVGGELFSVRGAVSWTHWIASSNVLADDWTCDVLLSFVDSEVPPTRAMWEGTSVNPLSVGNWGGAFAGGRGSARKHGACLMRSGWLIASTKGCHARSRSPQTWSPNDVNGHGHRVKNLGAARVVEFAGPGCREYKDYDISRNCKPLQKRIMSLTRFVGPGRVNNKAGWGRPSHVEAAVSEKSQGGRGLSNRPPSPTSAADEVPGVP